MSASEQRGFGILVYHRISRRAGSFEASIAVDPRVFERQLRRLARCNVISLPTAVDMLERHEPFPPQTYVITMDDGYRDNWSEAYPILRAYNVPATIFLATGYIDRSNLKWDDRLYRLLSQADGKRIVVDVKQADGRVARHELDTARLGERELEQLTYDLHHLPTDGQELALAQIREQIGKRGSDNLPERLMLSWEEVRFMAQSPLITLGSHTVSHRSLAYASCEEIESEVVASKRQIEERTGQPVAFLSYPYGQPEDVPADMAGLLRACGYRAAVTYVFGSNRPDSDLFALKRVRVHNFAGPGFDWKLRLRLSPWGEAIKRHMNRRRDQGAVAERALTETVLSDSEA